MGEKTERGRKKMKRAFCCFPFIFLICCQFNISGSSSKNMELHVGVILDMGTPLGKQYGACISRAEKDFYTAHSGYTTRMKLQWRDSKHDTVDAAAAAQDLLKNGGVVAIIGPQTSTQAQFVAELGNKAEVPILSFSATSPLLSTIQTPYFIRTGLSDTHQTKAIAALIKAFGWRKAVLICENTPHRIGALPYLTDALEQVDATVSYRSEISPLISDDEIAKELSKLKRMETRVFIVHMGPSLGSRFFCKARDAGMMEEGYAWIVTDGLINLLDSMNSSAIQSMGGVLGLKPYVPESNELSQFRKRLMATESSINPRRLNVYGLWAYDTFWVLAKAVEEVMGMESSGRGGRRLLDAIVNTTFSGLSGEFNLAGGQLELPSAFQIVNVFGKEERGVGFWTPEHGFHQNFGGSNTIYSTSKDNLDKIIWPGVSMTVPGGWKRLKIGVPKKGFTGFVQAERDPETNRMHVKGSVVEAFIAAVHKLNYPLLYDFHVFENESTGKPSGSYDDLIMQVYHENYDVVVGDTTITSNRSQYVDFTRPYTESGTAMLVLARKEKNKALIFLKPFSLDLWLTTGAAFIFTGAMVWALEHRVNEEFRGPLHHQIGVTLWFSFSTLVFAHRERLVSNGSKFVVIIWVLVVWILTNSYTASFTSRLTVDQLQPEVRDIGDLIKNGYEVGYQNGSFVRDLLTELQMDSRKLRNYTTAQELADALSKRSVEAVVDEIPYLKSFLAIHGNCAKFKMIGPLYQTAGFGFVFPRGSSIVPDISRAILMLEEERIKEKWRQLREEISCPDSAMNAASNIGSLHLELFKVLFFITGAASHIAFFFHLLPFLYQHRHLLIAPHTLSFPQRLLVVARLFLERDLSHYTVRRANGQHFPNSHNQMEPNGGNAAPSPPHSPLAAAAAAVSSVEMFRIGNTSPSDVGDDGIGQHLLTLHREAPSRRRWRLLYNIWRARSQFVHLHQMP